jgi:thiosulfate/3-mercaptopyruvate sulfurtransferase
MEFVLVPPALSSHAPMGRRTVEPAPAGFRTDLPRWRQLVSVEWLAALLAGQQVASAPAGPWLLLEVACDGLLDFQSGHIPAARYLDTRQFEQLPFWNRVPDAALLRVLRQAEVAGNSSVILYGRNPLAAARVAHLMLVAGVQDVRLLDGGLLAWCAAGHALRSAVEPKPQRRLPCAETSNAQDSATRVDAAPTTRLRAHPAYVIDTAQARALLHTPHSALVSIRTRAEYLGETSGYDYIAARGEIAGALWGHAGRDGDINSMCNFQDELGRMKPAAEIAALWQ